MTDLWPGREAEARRLGIEQCGNCRFWKRRTDPARDMGGGYCQRFPPIFKEENTLNDGWPNTHQQEWCGEWSAKI